jgi:hypothetical protein
MNQRNFVDMKLNVAPEEFKRQYLNYPSPPSPPPEEMAAQAERMKEKVFADMEAGFSRMTAATISHPKPLPTVNELYDAMAAMKAECDRIASQIPDTQIIITGTIKGPPENLATTGGNVFITFPRRKPVDIVWLASWIKGMKASELRIAGCGSDPGTANRRNVGDAGPAETGRHV